jgi:multicomponent Na+:H+ antiporter subunit D
MILFAFLCIALGVWPQHLYALLPYPVDYQPYTVPHVVNMLQLLLFSGMAFFLMLPLMKRTLTITLDFDWFYRTLGPGVIVSAADRIQRGHLALETGLQARLDDAMKLAGRCFGEESPLARTAETSQMVLTVLGVLFAFLFLAFFVS